MISTFSGSKPPLRFFIDDPGSYDEYDIGMASETILCSFNRIKHEDYTMEESTSMCHGSNRTPNGFPGV